MKILAISDLHLDLDGNTYPSRKFIEDLLSIKDFDVLTIAGDIANNNRISFMFLKKVCETFKDKQIIFVPGNHDFYNRLGYYKEIDKIKNKFKVYNNFYVLYNSVLIHQDYAFIGSTLWTNMQYNNDVKMNTYIAQRNMNDYYKIRKDDKTLINVFDTIKENQISFDRIKEFVGFEDNRKIVLITHHAPSTRSIPARYMNEDTNCAYVNNYDDFIRDSKINLWIHGHIHSYNDYQIGNTRIFSNPFGYDYERFGFEFKIIEV